MTETDENSDALLAKLRNGDMTALGELFSLNRERLWRMVNFRLDQRLRGRVDADDVLQEAYLDAAQRIEHYQNNASMSFFVWLRQIVLQTMIDLHRQHLGAQMRNAAREVSLHGAAYPQATSISLAAHLLGSLTSPSGAAMREEVSIQLEKALDSMSEIDREILALRHFEELTNSEVAEVLNIQQKAASIRYVRAIARLKDILEQVPGFFDGR
jgi:RNA polymerase sigma-70 factor (ECF subfamily)